MNQQREHWRIRLEAYLAGVMPAEERRAFETETVADAELAEEFYAAMALDEAVREEAGGAASGMPSANVAWWRRRIWLVALPAAAALAFLLLLPSGPPAPGSSPEAVLRGEAADFRGLSPSGEVTTPPERFVWTAAEGAVRYRFELFDAAGRLQLTRVVTDTFLAIAPGTSLGLEVGGEPYWRVVPVSADGRELGASDPVFFGLDRP